MKKATISQTKNKLSLYIDAVKHGETIIILDRDVPVAKLEPLGRPGEDELDTHLCQLERTGLLRRKKCDLPKDFFQRDRPKIKEDSGIIDALLKDREDGR